MWNEYETEIFVQFDKLPLKKELTFKLFNWYESFNEGTDNTNGIPFSSEVVTDCVLTDKRTLHKGEMITLSFWSGIYSKWKQCYKPKMMNRKLPVTITLFKESTRKWSIISIKQNETETRQWN